MTRPDTSFPVSVVSQFLKFPCHSHWNAVVRILKYIKWSSGNVLVFADRGLTGIIGYPDADLARDPSIKLSISCYCIFIGGNISWKSEK